MGPTSGRPVCDLVQSQTPEVCVSSSRPDSLGSGCPESSIGESGCVPLSSSLSSQPGALEGSQSGLSQNDFDCSRLAQHALVLGRGQSLLADSYLSSSSEKSGHTAVNGVVHRNLNNLNLHAWLLRASAIQEQGFSDELAA